MNQGTSKKVIFSFFLFINFIQPGKSADFKIIDNLVNKEIKKVSWSKISTKKNNKENWSKILNIKNSHKTSKLTFNDDLRKYPYPQKNQKEILKQISKVNSQKLNELVIQSDTQTEKNNIFMRKAMYFFHTKINSFRQII